MILKGWFNQSINYKKGAFDDEINSGYYLHIKKSL